MGVAVILVAMIVLFVPVVVMVMAMIVVPVPMVVMVMAVVVPMIMPVIMFLGLLEGLAADNAPGRHDHVARRAHILFVVFRVRMGMGMIMPMPMIVVMPVIMIVGPVLMVVVVVPVVVPVVVIAMVVMGLVFFGHGADACCFARGIIGTEEYPIYGEVLPARQAMV